MKKLWYYVSDYRIVWCLYIVGVKFRLLQAASTAARFISRTFSKNMSNSFYFTTYNTETIRMFTNLMHLNFKFSNPQPGYDDLFTLQVSCFWRNLLLSQQWLDEIREFRVTEQRAIDFVVTEGSFPDVMTSADQRQLMNCLVTLRCSIIAGRRTTTYSVPQ